MTKPADFEGRLTSMQLRPAWFVAVAALAATLAVTAASAQPPQGAGGRGGRGQGQPPDRAGQPRDARGNQALPAGTASVSGTVVVAGTGQPARRARVTLNATEGGGSRTATTDEEGRYAFDQLAAGRYNVSASKSGHVGITYGQARPGRPGTPIQLTEGQKFAANLQLPRGSVITGTVVDEYGEATAGTQVRVLRRSEEHTSELQSPCNLVCRLLLARKNSAISTTSQSLSSGGRL